MIEKPNKLEEIVGILSNLNRTHASCPICGGKREILPIYRMGYTDPVQYVKGKCENADKHILMRNAK